MFFFFPRISQLHLQQQETMGPSDQANGDPTKDLACSNTTFSPFSHCFMSTSPKAPDKVQIQISGRIKHINKRLQLWVIAEERTTQLKVTST